MLKDVIARIRRGIGQRRVREAARQTARGAPRLEHLEAREVLSAASPFPSVQPVPDAGPSGRAPSFLRIDGIDGESTDDKLKDTIEIDSYVGEMPGLGAGAGTFLRIDGIDGESTDDKHKNTIEVQSVPPPSSPTEMPQAMFLKIDGIDGETTDDKHKNEIDIDVFREG